VNISVILAGGTGVRFGNETPKQYQFLLGKEVIHYAVDALRAVKSNDKILIASAENDMQRLNTSYGVECVLAGNTHNRSIKNALDYIKINYPSCEKVLFLDSARPCINSDIVEEYFSILDTWVAVITAKHITDSLGCTDGQYTDRSLYFLIQKPEAFNFNAIYKYFDSESEYTAIVQHLPSTTKIYRHYSSDMNLKITYPHDIGLAEYLIKTNDGGI
jgi:2-C-methyl-D-erythritol 4-phosphate cytidylyltransferase